ncbi:hypothetical protein [Massilia yuzhufengensis]|uniref:Lipoprotein n=1 Tax=Massilia yuzhufengensis TaxID=1164594 RepID=A0A1I1EYS5_9BURK|nr:hypothetical protein [Massilia yuzhufengensis]SFB90080.1 hypothetical protein SAMN05216204_102228 [Massilia yuzhufengensis]
MQAGKRWFSRGLLLLAAAMPLLAACDAARENLAQAIRPASANEVAGGLRAQIAQGKFAEASAEGARFLKDQQDTSGVVAWETAKASAQAGKLDDAVRFAGLAVKGGTVAGVDLMGEPMLEPVRTDPRFVHLAATGGDTAEARVFDPVPAAAPAAASIGASGVTASAGDVAVELPQ